MPLTIAKEWVKGHYQGKNRQLEHIMNEHADDLAGAFQKH
jgi:hypothetical protein